MAGHSKWANIKHRKGKVDQIRAKIFGNLIREITIAAKMGDSNPQSNARLRLAVSKAKAANMPNKTIDSAIAKGSNDTTGSNYNELIYEGYGPLGISLIVEALTDNKTRTVANVRYLFNKHGGSIGEAGSVVWAFKQAGIITLNQSSISENKLLDIVLEAGGEDLSKEEDIFIITAPQNQLHKVIEELQKRDLATESAKIVYQADNEITLDADNTKKAMTLIEALEDDNDIQNVYSNAIFDSKTLANL